MASYPHSSWCADYSKRKEKIAMSQQKSQKIHHVPVFGIFLFFVGIIFLLQTFNILSWNLWQILWKFWPVLVIIIGLTILLRRWNPWLVSILIMALLSACFFIMLWQYTTSTPELGFVINYKLIQYSIIWIPI